MQSYETPEMPKKECVVVPYTISFHRQRKYDTFCRAGQVNTRMTATRAINCKKAVVSTWCQNGTGRQCAKIFDRFTASHGVKQIRSQLERGKGVLTGDRDFLVPIQVSSSNSMDPSTGQRH